MEKDGELDESKVTDADPRQRKLHMREQREREESNSPWKLHHNGTPSKAFERASTKDSPKSIRENEQILIS